MSWSLTVVRPERSSGPSVGDPGLAVAWTNRRWWPPVSTGRDGAFDLIVERHRRPVYQLCYRFVGNHEDASDLSQDVFLRAYRGLRAIPRAVVARDLAVSDWRQRLPEPREPEDAAERADR